MNGAGYGPEGRVLRHRPDGGRPEQAARVQPRRDALARIVPREAPGRVIGIFNAVSAAAIVAGAVLAPVLVASTSLRASLLILGAAALAITLVCGLGPRGLDALSAQQADALASRVKVLQGLPVTAGVPLIVPEQLAAAARFCPLLPGVDVVVQGAPAHAFYAIVDGRVVVHRDGTAIAHLGPRDSFGERGRWIWWHVNGPGSRPLEPLSVSVQVLPHRLTRPARRSRLRHKPA